MSRGALSQQSPTCLPAGAAMFPAVQSSPRRPEQTPALPYSQKKIRSHHANQVEDVENPGVLNLPGTLFFLTQQSLRGRQ